MKPVIGITADMDKEAFKLRRDYVRAIVDAGGMAVVITPPERHIKRRPAGTARAAIGSEKESDPGAFAEEDVQRIAEIIDGLLLSGGGDLSPDCYQAEAAVPPECLHIVERQRSDFEMRLLREIMTKGKPVLGICYGMQLINVALQGTLYQDIGLQIRNALDHRKGDHVVSVRQPLSPPVRFPVPSISVNSSHHQAVETLGEGLEMLAVAQDGVVEGLFKRDYPFLLGVQWHPERICHHASSRALFEEFVARARAGSMVRGSGEQGGRARAV